MATGTSGQTADRCVRETDGNKLDQVVGPVHHSPWLATLQYACLGILLAVLVPFSLQMLVMVAISKDDLAEHANLANTTSLAKVRVEHSWFTPYGVWGGCVVAFFSFSVCGACNGKFLNAILRLSKDTAEFGSLFCCGCKQATESREDTRAGHQDRDDHQAFGKSSCPNLRITLPFLLAASLAPLAAWYGPFIWWREAAELYRLCHRVCKFADLDPDGVQACKVHMDVTPDEVDEARLLKNVTEDDPGFCFDVMNRTEMSAYTRHVLHKGHTFLAFESNLRQHFRVSCLDIFGSTLGLLLFIVVVGATVALKEQFSTLRRLRAQNIKHDLVKDPATLDTWVTFFGKLYAEIAQAGIDQAQDSWTLKKLKAAQSERDNNKTEVPKALEKVFEDDEHDTADMSCADTIFTLIALFSAAVDASVPLLCRYYFRMGRSNPLVISDKYPHVMEGFQCVSILSLVVGFVGAFSSFYLLSSAYVSNQSQINTVIAFDCLFRFPFEHPQTTVYLSNGQSLRKVLTLKKRPPRSPNEPDETTRLKEDITPRASESSRADSDSEYFAEFTIPEKIDSAKFQYYCLGRQYLQVDKVDERNTMETAMVVALLSLIPRLLIVLCNWYLETGPRRILQPANLALLCRLLYVFVLSMLSLSETMNLNEHFSMHRTRLEKLLHYCRYCKALKGTKDQNEQAGKELDHVTKVIDEVIKMMDSHDLPSTLFGVKVRWQMLASFVAVWSLSLPSTVVWLGQLIDYLSAAV